VNGNSGHLQAQCHSSTNGRSSELINYWELHFSYQTGLVACGDHSHYLQTFFTIFYHM